MSSTGCNPAASCCGGSTPPVRTSAVRERRNACLRRRAIHNDLLGPARGRSDQRSSSAMCQRGDRRALPNVARRRPRGAARSARSSRRCVPRTRRPTPNRGRAGSGTHADRSGGAGMRPRLPRLGRRTSPPKLVCHASEDISGDEALVAERLVCTEEERVRLPPSPLHLGPQHEVGDCTRGGFGRLPARHKTRYESAGRRGFESLRLHSSLRSVNGKHAPFVRPRCGFDSCRRLLPTPVAQWTERCSATAEAAGSSPAGRTLADVAQGKSTGAPPRGGPFDPGRPLS